MSFWVTPEPNWILISLAFFLTFVGCSCWDLSRWLTASSDSASMDPLRTSPVRARASQTNSAIQGSGRPLRPSSCRRGLPDVKVYRSWMHRVKVYDLG